MTGPREGRIVEDPVTEWWFVSMYKDLHVLVEEYDSMGTSILDCPLPLEN